MEDAGNDLTEQALAELEGQIRRVYAQAAKELGETISAYFEAFQKRDEKMKKIIGTVRNGREWTEEDYKQWRLNQIARGERFEALRDKLAQRVTDAKEVALSYVNDKTPGIYSLNRNYTAYEIEGISGGDFTLLDEQTVKRLVKDAPDLMPYYPEEKAVKRGFDLKFGKQQITAGVTSGILRGSSIPQMEKDLRNRIVTMSQVSSIRAARTAVTQAQNAGRMALYQAAADMGIPVQKKWVCVKDFRTRWDHGMADGQVVSYDEAFNVGGYKMMFPGDESHGAPGHELYNCRCRTVTGHDLEFEEEPRQMRVKNPETGEYEVVNEMTYEQWYKAKQEENPEAFSGWVKAGKNYQADQREYAEYQQLLGKKAPKTFASYQNMKYNSSEEWKALQGLYVSAAGKKAGVEKSVSIESEPEVKPATLRLSNLEEFEEWQNKYYAENANADFTRDANPNIAEYSGGAYEAINAVERGGAAYEKALRCYGNLDCYKTMSDDLSDELSKFKLTTDLNVKRVVGDVGYITGAGSSVDDMVASIGKTYTEKGFTSTSIANDANLPFELYRDTRTVLEIAVPKSTRGAYIYKMSDNPAEFEFLIDKGTTYKVLDAGERTVKEYIIKSQTWEDTRERYMKLEVVSQ